METFHCFWNAGTVAKVALKQNYGAMLLALGCVAMGMHADIIRNTFDGCPMSIFVGKSGRGKIYSLNIGLVVLGKLHIITL